MNRALGTAVPQMQLDILPGIRCAAHFTIQRRSVPPPGDDVPALLRAGQGIQRFWLTATQMGLAMQPALAPLCFGFYAKRDGLPNVSPTIKRKLGLLATKLAEAEQFDPDQTLFRGRI